MLNLFRSEWKKATGNRCLVGCTIWIWPILSLVIIGIFLLVFLVNGDARADLETDPIKWTEIALLAWAIPNNFIVRLFLMGFVASVFATEYHHNTWKTVLPGNNRLLVILMKFVAVASFIVLAFTIMMIVMMIGFGLMSVMLGVGYPPAISGDVMGEFLEELFLNMILTFVSTMILAGVAALAALVTRSLLFGVVASVGLTLLEGLGVPIFVVIAYELLNLEWLADIYLLTPTYNTGNIFTWINADESAQHMVPDGSTLSLAVSILILTIYMLIVVGGSMFAFQRQDI